LPFLDQYSFPGATNPSAGRSAINLSLKISSFRTNK
jgi:hypothetical protein